MECEFCKKYFNNMSSLKRHKNTAKYCLKIQNITTLETIYMDTLPDIDETDMDIDMTYDQNCTDHLNTLEIKKGFHIEYHFEDGYINVSILLMAGGKQFKDWKVLDTTKKFIQVLSDDLLIKNRY
jgi:hypothetical protein